MLSIVRLSFGMWVCGSSGTRSILAWLYVTLHFSTHCSPFSLSLLDVKTSRISRGKLWVQISFCWGCRRFRKSVGCRYGFVSGVCLQKQTAPWVWMPCEILSGCSPCALEGEDFLCSPVSRCFCWVSREQAPLSLCWGRGLFKLQAGLCRVSPNGTKLLILFFHLAWRVHPEPTLWVWLDICWHQHPSSLWKNTLSAVIEMWDLGL